MIERIEELRYLISRDTHAMLRARKAKDGDSNVKALERSIAEMKKEFEKALEGLKAEGFEYALMGEKRIDEIHSKFMRLSQEERNAALAGEGDGARLIEETDAVLKENYENRGRIADFLISLNVIMERGDSARVRKFVEGYLDSVVFQIRRGVDKLDVELFAEAAEELGFICRIEGKTCELRQHPGPGSGSLRLTPPLDLAKIGKIGRIGDIGQIGRISGEVGKIGIRKLGKVFDKLCLFGVKKEEEKEEEETRPQAWTKTPAQPVQSYPAKEQPAQQVQPPQQHQSQPSLQSQLSSAAAQQPQQIQTMQLLEAKAESNQPGRPELEEIDRRMAVILQNKKMQRWVLNMFKDDAEREEYEKAQAVLVNLMRMKKEMLKKQHQ